MSLFLANIIIHIYVVQWTQNHSVIIILNIIYYICYFRRLIVLSFLFFNIFEYNNDISVITNVVHRF
jgi:hypothetical protein